MLNDHINNLESDLKSANVSLATALQSYNTAVQTAFQTFQANTGSEFGAMKIAIQGLENQMSATLKSS